MKVCFLITVWDECVPTGVLLLKDRGVFVFHSLGMGAYSLVVHSSGMVAHSLVFHSLGMGVYSLVFHSVGMGVYSLVFHSLGMGVYSLMFHSLGMGVYLLCRTATSTACVPDPLSPYLNTGSLKTEFRTSARLGLLCGLSQVNTLTPATAPMLY